MIEISLIVVGVVVSLIGYLTKSKVEAMESKINQLEKVNEQLAKHEAMILSNKIDIQANTTDIKEFHENYLDRFDAMNKIVYESKLDIMKELNKIYNKLSEHGRS